MTDLKIAVILGSTRPGRAGAAVAEWVLAQAKGREGASYDLVDLKDYDLDLLNEPTVPGAAKGHYENPKTTRWSETIADYDGFVFVTAEYNHSIPAAFKNAVDVLFPEWNHKAVTFVSYGADSGVRAVEHWRAVVANVMMQATRGQLALSLFTEFEDGSFLPNDRRAGELGGVLDQLEALAGAVKPLRA